MNAVRGWGLAISVWAVASIGTHVFYIKRVRFSPEHRLAAVPIIDGPNADGTSLHTALQGGLFGRATGELNRKTVWSALDSLADYLLRHPERTLFITGYHTAAESSQTLVSDIGKLRAEAVRQYLMAAGVSPDQTQTQGRVTESIRFVNDSTTALAFAFEQTVVKTPTDLAHSQHYIDLFHPLALYFPTGGSAFILTPDNKQFAADAVSHLRLNPRAMLIITGHTDSVGSDTGNRRLSLRRAKTVRGVLVRQGIRAGQCQVIAHGETEPIAPNSTAEGREANRRVTVVIGKSR